MRLRVLGAHSRETSLTRCTSLLVDDSMALDAGCLMSTLDTNAQLQITDILVTHEHFDHVRDIPMLALNLFHEGGRCDVRSTPPVLRSLEAHFLNGATYPRFQTIPAERPTVTLQPLNPHEPAFVRGLQVLALPVHHSVGSVGYQVSDESEATIFFTGDTRPGLLEHWPSGPLHLLVVEVTFPNRMSLFASQTGHLTPADLHGELMGFRRLKGYVPRTLVVHMDPAAESEIREELTQVAESLKASIMPATEGMEVLVSSEGSPVSERVVGV